MKKRVIAALMATVLTIGGMAGCGKTTDDREEKEKGETAGKEEITTIYWQWPSLGSTGSGFQAVEDALNEMMEKDIGVHVVLEPVLVTDLLNQTTLTVTSGEQLDLSLQIGTGVGTYVSNGLIQPIDEYIDEYGADIKEKCGDSLNAAYYQDKLYGMPVAYISGNAYGYVARKDILDKYGITVDENKIYTLDEIEDIFATVKAGEGEKFFLNIPQTNSAGSMLHGAYCEDDMLGASRASGVLMLNRSFEDLSIVNLFETEEYKDYANRCYDWAQKGYVSADAATNTEDPNVLIASGNYLGAFTWTSPNGITDMQAATGYELVGLTTVAPYIFASNLGISWQVPITSENPGKAVEAMNYIYKNPEACALLKFGIEGQDYEVVEKTEDGTQIKYLADDPSTLPYYTPFGVYGDRLSWPVVQPTPVNMNKIMKEWDEAIPENRISAANGYTFVADSVSTEISAVNAVITQYSDSIEAGALNPEEALPEFIKALKGAGIDKVIEENQRQLDEWAEKQK